jgi:hypothetical protein
MSFIPGWEQQPEWAALFGDTNDDVQYRWGMKPEYCRTQVTKAKPARQKAQKKKPQKRTVALAEGGSDANAFKQRAEKSASTPGDVRQFNTGDEIVSGLQDLSASGAEIDKVVINSHGYGPGVIGIGKSNGLYIDWEQHPRRQLAARGGYLGSNAELAPEAATTGDLVSSMTGDNPSIKLAKGATIVFFGCNSIALASHLSYELGQAGRGDIQVVGSTDKVYPKNGNPAVDHGGTFQTYQGGKMISETKRMTY